ncbi:MAG: hypothetical protein R3350_07705, partial [Saprospiraceae bacterium]|nr:hypothetical protein [Saprospiraceae bacterium]
FFRRRLENYATETPVSLWKSIDRIREKERIKLRRKNLQRRMAVLTLIFLLGAAGLWWMTGPGSETVGSFPIVEKQSISTVRPLTSKLLAAPAPLAKPVEALPVRVEGHLEPAVASEQGPFSIPAPATDDRMSIPSLPPIRSDRHEGPLTITVPPLTSKPQCASFSGKGAQLLIEFMVSPDAAFRSLQPIDAQFAEYNGLRRRTELKGLSYSSSLRLTYLTPSGLSLSSGLQYARIGERFSYATEGDERITVTTIYGSDGEIIGTDTLTEQVFERITASNQFESLDLPVLLGYEFSHHRFAFSLQGGAFFNLFFRAKGKMLSPEDLQPVDFSREEQSAFRDQLGVSWYGSLGIHYRLTPQLQLSLRPHLRYYPDSFTRAGFVSRQNYMTAGLFFGIRKNLMGRNIHQEAAPTP